MTLGLLGQKGGARRMTDVRPSPEMLDAMAAYLRERRGPA